MSGRRLSARAVRHLIGIGQRWRDRKTGAVIAVYQVHRAEHQAEVHLAGTDPHVPRTRFQIGFEELGRSYELLDERKEAA